MMNLSMKFSFCLVLVCIALTSSSTVIPTTSSPAEISIDDASVNGTGSSIKESTASNDTCSQFTNATDCCQNETAIANNCSYCLRVVDGTEGLIGCASTACAEGAKLFCELSATTASPNISETTTANSTDGNSTTVAPAVETTTTNASSPNTTTPGPAPETTTTAAPVQSTTTDAPAPTNATELPPANTTTSGNSTESTTAMNNGGDSDGQQFDGASFIGGIILCGGLVALIFFGLKFYKGRKEQNYHTL